ncbi:MFS-type efflux pump MFS1 [Pseudocercospora fuligena]|uniref:MFS-type efflux pump MFS1 n=1 Tax=Pseudocercospora fuligena TaxID=685502 RepID=A0A8H6VJW7_9PEZI|nr:MFS-type efflux pump MFS1 [Pseudocercospora fuligena]
MSSDAAIGYERAGGSSQHHFAVDANQATGDEVSSPIDKKPQISIKETLADLEGVGVDAQETTTSQYPRGVRFWFLMFNLGAVIVLGALDISIVATAVPRITDHFHTIADVGWYSVAFRLTQCSFQFLYGKAYKIFPIKRVFLIANLFSFLGSLLCGTAVSSTMLVVGRAVAGVGTAGLDAGAYIMLIQSTPLRIRPTFLGLWGAIEGLTTVAGPLIGGAITQTIGWRWCFYIAVPLGGATLLLTFFFFEERVEASSSEAERPILADKLKDLDMLSTLILLPALTCLFLAFSWAGTRYSWHSSRIIALLLTSTILTTLFTYNQIRLGNSAALPIRILKSRTLLASLTFILFQNSAGNVLEYYLPIYYQAVQSYTPAQSGLLMLPILLVATAGAILSGFGTSVCGYYAPFMIFASITMSIAAGLVTTFGMHTSLVKMILYTGLFGLGYGVGSTGPTTAIQTVLSDEDVSIGLAILLFGSAFGPAVMISVAQVIFTNQLQGVLPGNIAVDERGLTEIVQHAAPDRVDEMLLGVNKSIVHTWYLVIALACATFVGSLAVEWRSVKKDDPNKESEKASEVVKV